MQKTFRASGPTPRVERTAQVSKLERKENADPAAGRRTDGRCMAKLAELGRLEGVDAVRAVVEGAPVMLWLGDEQGQCIFLNRELREFWGVEDLARFDWSSTIHPEDRDCVFGPFAKAMAAREPFETEARYRRADGAYRIIRTMARPRFGATGRFLGMTGVNVDVTEQRATEQAERLAAEQLQLALDASDVIGTWIWYIDADIVHTDRGCAAAFNLPDDDSDRYSIERFIDAVEPEDQSALRAAIANAMGGDGHFRCEYRIRGRDGIRRWVLATGRCSFDAAGRPLRFPGAMVDITERKATEAELSLLTRELSHRIKNSFAVMQSLLMLSARKHEPAAPVLLDLTGRLQAMAAAHECVRPDADKLRFSGSLMNLLRTLLAPYREDSGARLTLSGEDCRIGPKAANSLAFIFHELATNAVKHGALAHADGTVAAEVEIQGPDCVIAWTESAPPRKRRPSAGDGFGSFLVATSARNLGGTIEAAWPPEGLLWRIRLPRVKLEA